MDPHSWDQIRADVGRQFVQKSIHFTEGYIRALEDLLRETAHLRDDPDPGGKYTAAQRSHWYGRVTVWKQMRRIAGHKLHKARATLSSLKEIGS